FVNQIQSTDRVSEFESQIRRRDGSIIWISENVRAVRDDYGNLLYYEGTVVDITRRKAAEESLRRAHEELEHRVRQRTQELNETNHALQEEILVRKNAEESADRANQAK